VPSLTPGSLVLFLGGDPALARRLASQPVPTGVLQRLALTSTVLTHRARTERAGAPAGALAWPPDQVMCAQRVLDLAKKAGRAVRLVDVNQPGDDRPLVAQYVGEADLLPLLVRSDGARLEGVEAFTSEAVRTFLAHL
jgi:hypothetical protein